NPPGGTPFARRASFSRQNPPKKIFNPTTAPPQNPILFWAPHDAVKLPTITNDGRIGCIDFCVSVSTIF
ncbi:hypothetical protein NKI74_27385, partial [Mesorhizobium sp. M0494]|uniref:hypothetical protein n=1 Tax=Mesorhizobium sp. M0494 TaxID=2956951 RepID=UPI00333BFD08